MMNKKELIEDIEDSGIAEIKYIFDNLNLSNSNQEEKNEIEITDEVLSDLKKLLILTIEKDDEFALKVEKIQNDSEEPAPAGDLIIGGIVIIALAPLCVILTMHMNQLRADNPNRDYTDCKDLLEALHLDELYSKFS